MYNWSEVMAIVVLAFALLYAAFVISYLGYISYVEIAAASHASKVAVLSSVLIVTCVAGLFAAIQLDPGGLTPSPSPAPPPVSPAVPSPTPIPPSPHAPASPAPPPPPPPSPEPSPPPIPSPTPPPASPSVSPTLSPSPASGPHCDATGPRARCGTPNATQADCTALHCCWQPSALQPQQPQCFAPNMDSPRYRASHMSAKSHQVRAVLKLEQAALPALGPDWETVEATATRGHYERIQIKYVDMDVSRWEVPSNLFQVKSYNKQGGQHAEQPEQPQGGQHGQQRQGGQHGEQRQQQQQQQQVLGSQEGVKPTMTEVQQLESQQLQQADGQHAAHRGVTVPAAAEVLQRRMLHAQLPQQPQSTAGAVPEAQFEAAVPTLTELQAALPDAAADDWEIHDWQQLEVAAQLWNDTDLLEWLQDIQVQDAALKRQEVEGLNWGAAGTTEQREQQQQQHRHPHQQDTAIGSAKLGKVKTWVTFDDHPFYFKVHRKSVLFDQQGHFLKAAKDVVFDNSHQRLVLKDQYLEISTRLPADGKLFGLANTERPYSGSLEVERDGVPRTLFPFDTRPDKGNGNTYGMHPIVWLLLPDGRTHAYVLVSSNAMDVIATNDTLTFRVVGGVYDMHVLPGPTPEMVNRQLIEVVGPPAVPPQWSLGFHQCRYGYRNLSALYEVLDGYEAAGLHLEALWTDIDYMHEYRDFTTDSQRYNEKEFARLVAKLHADDISWVPILDPGIKVEPGYVPYDEGKKADVWIRDATGEPLLGKVWPGITVWPDFMAKRTGAWWRQQLGRFYDKLPFDGLWLDMNEASNFQSNPVPYDVCNMVHRKGNASDLECYTLEQLQDNYTFTDAQWAAAHPPYAVNNHGISAPLGTSTLPLTAQRVSGELEYNTHALYGIYEVSATYDALVDLGVPGRPFILTRSSFLGTGQFAANWNGDAGSTWGHLRSGHAYVLTGGLMALPFTGTDICGFYANTTMELCARWAALGAFHPFSRNHYESQLPQEYFRWPEVTTVARRAYALRYQLLPALYNAFQASHMHGTPVARPMWYDWNYLPETHAMHSQFTFVGGKLLVIPVLEEGVEQVEGYFPEGALWHPRGSPSHPTVDARLEAKWVNLTVPLTEFAAYLQGGNVLPMYIGKGRTTRALRNGPLGLLAALPVDLQDPAAGLTDGQQRFWGEKTWQSHGWMYNDHGVESPSALAMSRCNFLQFSVTVRWQGWDNSFHAHLTTSWGPPPHLADEVAEYHAAYPSSTNHDDQAVLWNTIEEVHLPGWPQDLLPGGVYVHQYSNGPQQEGHGEEREGFREAEQHLQEQQEWHHSADSGTVRLETEDVVVADHQWPHLVLDLRKANLGQLQCSRQLNVRWWANGARPKHQL